MDASRLKFLRLLSTLRSVALPGQALAITVALHGLGLPLHATPLWLGVLLLALFQLWVMWRLQHPQSLHASELALHLGVDLAALTWLLFWSGGSANPFVSLYLVPIALSAVGLPGAWVWAVGAASGLAYVLMALFAPAFPHVHGDVSLGFDRHLWGMAINFGLSALVFILVLRRLASALGEREHELSKMREQALRNEGIVALGTHAASLAHELNTPLGSMALLLDDLVVDYAEDPRLAEDHALLKTLTAECRDRVRSLVQRARGEDLPMQTLDVFLQGVLERWSLTRPDVAMDVRGLIPTRLRLRANSGMEHLLLALLHNAADASASKGLRKIGLEVSYPASAQTTGGLLLQIRDYGPGIDSALAPRLGRLFESGKAEGLGLGLALSHAAVEQLGGRLSLRPHVDGGSLTRVELPMQAFEMDAG